MEAYQGDKTGKKQAWESIMNQNFCFTGNTATTLK